MRRPICIHRTPVEDLQVGDQVRAVEAGPIGTVVSTDDRWIIVNYSRADGFSSMPYQCGVDGLYLVRQA